MLANKIQSELDDFKDISVENSNDKSSGADITLANRWLEHCNHSIQIHNLFSNIAVNAMLVIESLNYQKLFINGNHSFLWDERISYFDLAYIRSFGSLYGFEEISSLNEDTGKEPFWTIILRKKDDTKVPKNLSIKPHLNQFNHNRVHIEKSLSLIKDRCQQYASLAYHEFVL